MTSVKQFNLEQASLEESFVKVVPEAALHQTGNNKTFILIYQMTSNIPLQT